MQQVEDEIPVMNGQVGIKKDRQTRACEVPNANCALCFSLNTRKMTFSRKQSLLYVRTIKL